jgi:hypothetical protein
VPYGISLRDSTIPIDSFLPKEEVFQFPEE